MMIANKFENIKYIVTAFPLSYVSWSDHYKSVSQSLVFGSVVCCLAAFSLFYKKTCVLAVANCSK